MGSEHKAITTDLKMVGDFSLQFYDKFSSEMKHLKFFSGN